MDWDRHCVGVAAKAVPASQEKIKDDQRIGMLIVLYTQQVRNLLSCQEWEEPGRGLIGGLL
jgi:hypothetical protein